MTAGLVRKELRELRPILVVAAFLLFLDCLEWLIQRSSSSRGAVATELSDFGPSLAAMLFVLAFAVGTGLLVREIDDRTLAFLDGLPIGRGRVFGTKVATAAGVLLLYPVGHVLMLMGQHLLERQSLDHALHPAESQSQNPDRLRQDPLSPAPQDREHVRPAQGLAACPHPLRPLRTHLHVRHLHRRNRHLLAAAMSPEPSLRLHPVGSGRKCVNIWAT